MPSPDQILESVVKHVRTALEHVCMPANHLRPVDPSRCRLPHGFLGAVLAPAFWSSGGFAPGVHRPGGPWGGIDCAWDDTHVWMIEYAQLDSLWCLRAEKHSVIAHAKRLTDLERLVRIEAHLSPQLRTRPRRLALLMQIWAADEPGFSALDWARTRATGEPITLGWDNEPAPELEGWKVHAPRQVCAYIGVQLWMAMITLDDPPGRVGGINKFEAPTFPVNQETHPC